MPQDNADQIAEQKIEEARRSHATELDLGADVFADKLTLTELPASIGNLPHLQKLRISGHQLTTLPESIGQLKLLESLDLSNNRLTALPPSLAELKKLQLLDLSHNQLTELPNLLGQLKSLETLNLFGNGLGALPDSMADLTKLQVLNIAQNKVTELPAWISRLSELKSLQVSSNKLATLPDSIGDLPQLQLVALSRNQLTALPSSLSRLGQLKSLDASFNQLIAMPDSLGQLVGLRRLYLGGNQLKALPESLGQLAQLDTLSLDRNKLGSVPEWLTRLTTLTSLNLLGNQLSVLPESFGKLNQLVWLDLEANLLRNLPASFSDLNQLKWLYLSSNQLSPFHGSLATLQTLEQVSFRGNPLVGFSESSIDSVSNLAILKEAGKIFYDRGQYDASLRSFCRVLDIAPHDPEALLWRCVALRSARRFSDTENAIDKGLSLIPGDLTLRIERGLLYYDWKKFQKAVDAFDEVLAVDNKNEDALLWRLASLRRLADFTKAQKELDAALALLPGNSALLEEKGRLAFEQDKFEEAVKFFDEALQQEPDRISATLGKVDALNRLNRDTRAFEILRELEVRLPDSTDVSQAIGFFHLGRNDVTAARKQFSALWEKHPEDVRGINGLGAVAFEEGKYEEAASYVKKSLEMTPYEAPLYGNLGWALVKQEPTPDLEQAERACQKALEYEPLYPSALGCLGLIAFKRGRLREAEDYFQSSIDSDKSQGRYADLGALYVLMGRYEEAEKTLNEAIKVKKDDPQPRLELANLYLQTGKPRDAVRECRYVMATAPNSESAPRALAIALIGANDYGEAEKVLREAIRKQDESKRWRLHLTLSQLLTRLADKMSDDDLYEEALREVKTAIRINPNAAELFFQKGILRSKAKDPRGALKDFEECLALDKDHYEAERYARLVRKSIKDDINQGSKWAGWTMVGIGLVMLSILWWARFSTPDEAQSEALAPTVTATASASPLASVVPSPGGEKITSAQTTPTTAPSGTDLKSKATSIAATLPVDAVRSKTAVTTSRVSDTVLTVMTPLLLGMIVVGFLLPGLVRLKFAGVEAELTQPKEVISSGPKGEVSLGGSLSTIK